MMITIAWFNYPTWAFWVRLGKHGPGISIKSAKAFKFFSERNGYTKYYYIGPIKIHLIKAGNNNGAT